MKQDDIVQTYTPDKQKLAELVIAAKVNNRTMAQYSIDTGISALTLPRIVNGKINDPLSINFIEKIYNQKCKEADFSFGTLLLANGMVRASVVERGVTVQGIPPITITEKTKHLSASIFSMIFA